MNLLETFYNYFPKIEDGCIIKITLEEEESSLGQEIPLNAA